MSATTRETVPIESRPLPTEEETRFSGLKRGLMGSATPSCPPGFGLEGSCARRVGLDGSCARRVGLDGSCVPPVGLVGHAESTWTCRFTSKSTKLLVCAQSRPTRKQRSSIQTTDTQEQKETR
eukprot:6176748-Pleurochrysis_carterae.AAC.1